MKANHSQNDKDNPYNHKFDYKRTAHDQGNNNNNGEEDGPGQGMSNKRPKSSGGKSGMIKFSSGYQSESPIVNRPVSPSGMPRRLFVGQVCCSYYCTYNTLSLLYILFHLVFINLTIVRRTGMFVMLLLLLLPLQ